MYYVYPVYEMLFKHNQGGKYVVEKWKQIKKNAHVRTRFLFSRFQQNWIRKQNILKSLNNGKFSKFHYSIIMYWINPYDSRRYIMFLNGQSSDRDLFLWLIFCIEIITFMLQFDIMYILCILICIKLRTLFFNS